MAPRSGPSVRRRIGVGVAEQAKLLAEGYCGVWFKNILHWFYRLNLGDPI